MHVNWKEQYTKHYENNLTSALWTLKAVQERTTATRASKLQALEVVSKQISEARRALIFLINTEEKGS